MTFSISLVAVCCSSDFGEIVGALAQFVEQPHVLDGDDGLGGEGLEQLDLLVGNGPHFRPRRRSRADRSVLLEHRRPLRMRRDPRAANDSPFESKRGLLRRSATWTAGRS